MKQELLSLTDIITIARDFSKKCYDKKVNAFLIFTDISGSTQLSNIDEKIYLERCFNHILYSYKFLRTTKRKMVKTIGDEVMLTEVLSTDDDTAETAEAIIASVIQFQKDLANYADINTKIGIHLCKNVVDGKVLTEEAEKKRETKDFECTEGDLFGKDMNLGARIMGIADEGQILISEAVFENLHEDLRDKAKQRTEINILNQKFKFDIPMEFYFKGFEERDRNGSIKNFNYKKVIQIKHDLKDESKCLSLLGYKFKCLTFFDIAGSYDERNVSDLIKKVKDIFPKRSYPYIFKKILGKTYPRQDEEFPYKIGILFQLQSYDTYEKVYHELKNKLGETLTSSFTNPIWNGYTKRFNSLEGEKSLSLWKTNKYTNSLELFKKAEYQNINLILVGYFDNLTISENFNEADNLYLILSSDKLLNPIDSRKTFSVEVNYDNSLYNWE